MAEIDEGSVIGNYRVIRLLGQGGMGTVYEVEHLELGTHYALKTFTFDPDNDANHALKKKFLEEGKLLARLKHPNLTHVFDLGFEEKTQMPYFVMDLVTYEDGETYTAEDIDLKDIDEGMVYKWFKQLASALDYIHGEGIVHRDIKPSNLLVDKDLNVVLTDFGISRIFGQKIKSEVEATRTVVTKTGRGKLVLGTEHYIAPEVADGEEATPKADAYSLGVMLLRWLTGFYYGDNPGAVALLSHKKYQWIGVISRLLAPANRRPENYTELVKQVKPAAKPTPAPKPKSEKKESKPKAGLLAAAVAVIVLGGICAGGYFIWRHMERTNAERDRQLAALAQQMREKEEADRKAKAEAEAAKKNDIPIVVTNTVVKVVAQEKKPEPVLVETPQEIVAEEVKEPKIEASKADEQQDELQEVAKKEEESLGPIPNVKYLWHDKKDAKKPLQVRFQLANGETIDLMPVKSATFFMGNDPQDKRLSHKVTLTYDFWMSKLCATSKQLREFAPYDFDDCKELEQRIKGECAVYKRVLAITARKFCEYLTQRYGSQLPDGYVFRLPTEAEYELSVVGPNSQWRYFLSTPNLWGKYDRCGDQCKTKLKTLRNKYRLDTLGKWIEEDAKIEGTEILLGGLASPNVSGVYDFMGELQLVADVFSSAKSDCFVDDYRDEEVDPIRLNGDKIWSLRRWGGGRTTDSGPGFKTFHLVVAPSIERLNKIEPLEKPHEVTKAPPAKYDWTAPRKITHPKEVQIKMMNGSDFVFCACSPGSFVMPNIHGQAKQSHHVKITRPYWMSKYLVTAKQWRDYSKYDFEGPAKELESLLSKNVVNVCVRRSKWMAFCKFLNEAYGHLLPQGYIFRLPTEAEYQMAVIGGNDRKGVIEDDVANYKKRAEAEFAKFLKKNKKVAAIGEWHVHAYLYDFAIGARQQPHAWGMYDLITSRSQVMQDEFLYESKDWAGEAADHLIYSDKEVDPLRVVAGSANRGLVRQAMTARWIVSMDFPSFAHIVIGPDLVAEKNGAGLQNLQNNGKELRKVLDPIVLKLAEKNEIEFVGCPAGLFEMGVEGDKEKNSCTRQHTVNITRPFWLSKFQVTKRQWSVYQKPKLSKYDEAMGGLETPMWDGVSYVEAMKFCEYLTKRLRTKLPPKYVVRLPTEAEWEYALRMNDFQECCRYRDWKYSLNAISVTVLDIKRRAEEKNYKIDVEDWRLRPIQVGIKEPNAIGLYDMIGNGYELMLDVIDPAKFAAKTFLNDDKSQTAVVYTDAETDPLRFYDRWGVAIIRGALYNCTEGAPYAKRWRELTGCQIPSGALCIRLCIGPDLMKERKIKLKLQKKK